MIAISIGPIDIYRYGIFYVLAFLSAYAFFSLLAKKQVFIKYPRIHLLLQNHVDDIILYSVLGVLIGGRLGQVLFYDLNYYLTNPIEILQFWKGGMSFIGGMIGVLISLIIFVRKRKLKKYELVWILDLVLTITPLGIMLGRIGNFLNQELYGIIVPYNFWGLSNPIINLFQKLHIFHIYSNIDTFLRVNTNLLASFFEGFLLLIVTSLILRNFIRKGTYRIGYITGIFLIWYSSVRFFLEYLRMDSQSEFIFYLSKSQRFFVVFFAFGLFFLLKKSSKIVIR
ncbi:MAG: prolipoprotein diacylglyceryl transferase [Candidatus Absconditicoccaceae bacterium]